MIRTGAYVTWLLLAACSVPEFEIVESAAVEVQPDAGRDRSLPDASTDARDTRAADPNMSMSGQSKAGSGAGGASGSGAPSQRAMPDTGGKGAMMDAGRPSTGAAGMGQAGAAIGGSGMPAVAGMGATGPVTPPRACAIWLSVDARDETLPEGVIEGGLENVASVATRQYVCRLRPAGGTYAVPGKWIPGLGCFSAFRNGNSMEQQSVLSGPIEVLTTAPGCTFFWRAGSTTTLPADVVDLGDPPGGRNYACHGYYSSAASSGEQIGTIIPTTTTPPVQECWFQSFVGTSQPQDPSMFEVLVQEPMP